MALPRSCSENSTGSSRAEGNLSLMNKYLGLLGLWSGVSRVCPKLFRTLVMPKQPPLGYWLSLGPRLVLRPVQLHQPITPEIMYGNRSLKSILLL